MNESNSKYEKPKIKIKVTHKTEIKLRLKQIDTTDKNNSMHT